MNEVFIKRLREERKIICKLTQKEMADLLGIPEATYRNYESPGIRHREPDFNMLVKIATVLDVTTDYLLGKDTI